MGKHLDKLRNLLAKAPAPKGTFKMPKLPSWRSVGFACELPPMSDIDPDAAKYFQADWQALAQVEDEINGYHDSRVASAVRSKDGKAKELDYLALQRDRYTNLLDQDGVTRIERKMETYLDDVDTQYAKDLHNAHGETIMRYNARLQEIGNHLRQGIAQAEQKDNQRLNAMNEKQLLIELIKLQKR